MRWLHAWYSGGVICMGNMGVCFSLTLTIHSSIQGSDCPGLYIHAPYTGDGSPPKPTANHTLNIFIYYADRLSCARASACMCKRHGVCVWPASKMHIGLWPMKSQCYIDVEQIYLIIGPML